MADTQRTRAAILALLADNATGDISAQDLRDTVVSALPDYGELYVSASAATTISVVNTWYAVSGTWTLGNNQNFSEPSEGRLQFDGDETRVVFLFSGMSVTGAASNVVSEMAFAKNGSVLTPSIIQRKLGTAGDVGAAALVGITTMAPGDYVDVRIRNTTSATNLTITVGNMIALVLAA